MTPPATEPARGWVVRCTWEITDPEITHPQHSYQTKPARDLAEAAGWDAWRGAYKGLTLAEIHLRRCPDGPWEKFLPRDCPDCEDEGTTELRDVNGRLLDASYCSCTAGERLRADEDKAAAEAIETANRDLAFVSYETLAAVRDGLRSLRPAGART